MAVTGAVLRVAVAGACMVSPYHLHAWRSVQGARVVAIADPDRDRARRRAAEFAIDAVYADVGEMLDAQRPDALDIAAGHAAHAGGLGASLLLRLLDEIDYGLMLVSNDGRVRMAMAIESNAHWIAAGMSTEELICRGYELARRLNVKITTHISGGTFSLEKGFLRYLRETGLSP